MHPHPGPEEADAAPRFSPVHRLLSIRRWVLLILVAGIPLTITPNVTLDRFNVPKLGLLIAGMSLVISLRLIGFAFGESLKVPRSAYVVPALILIPLLAAWIFSPYREWALFGQYWRYQGLIPYILVALLSISVAEAFRSDQRPLTWALAAAGGGVGLYLLVQMLGLDPTGTVIEGTRLPSDSSTLGNSNFVGGFLAIVLPFCLYLWLDAGRFKVIAMILTIFVIEGVILSFSEGAQAAALGGVLIFGGMRGAGGGRARRAGALGAAALIAVVLIGTVVAAIILDKGPATALSRGEWWAAAVKMAAESPIVGTGPNTFAVEGVQYRSIDDAIAHRNHFPGFTPVEVDYQTSDDPHSVPMSFLANAGAIGLAGLLIAIFWLLRSGWTAASGPLPAAFLAAVVAYLLQGLVSVDEPTLRLTFWVAVGGFVAATASRADYDVNRGRAPRSRGLLHALAVITAIALVPTGLWTGYKFIDSDRSVLAGAISFSKENPEDGKRALLNALEFRDEYTYRQVLAEYLGLAALDRGRDGAAQIDEMNQVNSHLHGFPKTGAILSWARILRYWSPYSQAAAERSLSLYIRAEHLDPNNPMITVEKAELLLDRGRESQAYSELRRFTDTKATRAPEFWGTLAMVYLQLGDTRAAAGAILRGVAIAPDACRIKIANELLRLAIEGKPPKSHASATALELSLTCDEGLYELFLRRVPPDIRSMYG